MPLGSFPSGHLPPGVRDPISLPHTTPLPLQGPQKYRNEIGFDHFKPPSLPGEGRKPQRALQHAQVLAAFLLGNLYLVFSTLQQRKWKVLEEGLAGVETPGLYQMLESESPCKKP